MSTIHSSCAPLGSRSALRCGHREVQHRQVHRVEGRPNAGKSCGETKAVISATAPRSIRSTSGIAPGPYSESPGGAGRRPRPAGRSRRAGPARCRPNAGDEGLIRQRGDRSTRAPSNHVGCGRHGHRAASSRSLAKPERVARSAWASSNRRREHAVLPWSEQPGPQSSRARKVLLERRSGSLEGAVRRSHSGPATRRSASPTSQAHPAGSGPPAAAAEELDRGQERQLDRLPGDDLLLGPGRATLQQPVRVRLEPRELGRGGRRRVRVGGQRQTAAAPARPALQRVQAAFVAIRYSHARNRPATLEAEAVARFRHARRNVSWTRSSASSREPSIR